MKTMIILTAIGSLALSGCEQRASSCMKAGETGRIMKLETSEDTGPFGRSGSKTQLIRFAMGKDEDLRLCSAQQTQAMSLLKVGDVVHVRDMTDVTP